MNNKGLRLLILLIPFFISSCADSMIFNMSRIIDDPKIVSPEARSFSDENIIEIEWEEDAGADEYVLYRSLDTINNTGEVYRGTETSYRDSNVINDTRYLYSLVKMRGSESFGPSETVLGVASMNVQDQFEPNNDESLATPFDYDLSANTFYYVSEGVQHIIEDRDWFCVEVSPRMNSLFKIIVDGVQASDPTGLMFYQKPALPDKIMNQVEIAITNRTYEKKTFYFCIYPDGSQIITNTHGGGRAIHYEVTYIGESPL